MEKLKKKLYAEIQSDPKYKNAYDNRNLNRPFSFVSGIDKKNIYYSDKPRNDTVYK